VRLLLDTHALVWWLAGDARLSPAARDAIADPGNDAFVSAASAWEVATKHRLGKFPHAGALALDFAGTVAAAGFAPLPVTLEHGQDAGALRWSHRDPFDRMLVAQALRERMALVTSERGVEQCGVVRLW
jgi:PIN domain nuclease of toxin-antitoxin system